MKYSVQINFYKCVQDSQELGSDNEHVVSRVFFSIIANGKTVDYYCNILQDIGSSFSYELDPLQVSNPFSEDIRINYEQFRNSAEFYYRSCVGSTVSSGIRIVGCSNVRMQNNILHKYYTDFIETIENSAAW